VARDLVSADESDPTPTIDRGPLVVAIPAELDRRSPLPVGGPMVQPRLDGDKAHRPRAVRAQLDDARPHNLDRLLIPEVHRGGPSPTGQVR
jgi:hypothetical protein